MAQTPDIQRNVEVTATMNCGCGYKTHETKDAIKHCRDTGHQMSFAGKITRSDKVIRMRFSV